MKRGRRGSALIEAAFVLPVLLLLVFGCFDITRVLHVQQIAAAAARAGAHRALVMDAHTLDLQAIEHAAVADAATPGLSAKASRACACSPASPTGPCDAAKCGAARAAYVHVETRAPVNWFIRYPWTPAGYSVLGSATVRIE